MDGSFFPNAWFGWLFYFALISILAIASYFDLRYLTIPKPVSIIALAIGLALNLVRGLWLGVEHDDLALGLWEAARISLGGFATGFGIFFLLWIFGLCGGGDVKLFAAVGAWLGMEWSFWLWVGSVMALAVVASSRLVLHTAFAGMSSTRSSFFANAASQEKTSTGKPRRRLLPYSLPLALAAVVMLLWFFRIDLGLVDRPELRGQNSMATSHPRLP